MTKKYSLGFVGRKAGMSRVFTEDGRSIPVTLIEATPNRIAQIKTVETDGYSAVQVTVGARRAAPVNKPEAGHFAKAKVEAGRGLWEFRVEDAQLGDFAVGGEVKADIFEVGQIVDVQGVTKGKGFQAPSSATTSVWAMQPTVTRCRIARRVRWVSARPRVAFSRARRCRATWARCSRAPRTGSGQGRRRARSDRRSRRCSGRGRWRCDRPSGEQGIRRDDDGTRYHG